MGQGIPVDKFPPSDSYKHRFQPPFRIVHAVLNRNKMVFHLQRILSHIARLATVWSTLWWHLIYDKLVPQLDFSMQIWPTMSPFGFRCILNVSFSNVISLARYLRDVTSKNDSNTIFRKETLLFDVLCSPWKLFHNWLEFIESASISSNEYIRP